MTSQNNNEMNSFSNEDTSNDKMNILSNEKTSNDKMNNEKVLEYSITAKGYKIPLDDKKVNDIKRELMILPYGENMTRYPVFRISEKYYRLLIW